MTDQPPTVSPSTAGSGRGWKILLAVSLALNLAVAGLVAGVALRGPEGGRDGRMAVRDLNFGPFTEALTRDQRRDMLRGFARSGPGLGEMRAQMRSDFDAVLAVLRAEPFDAERLDAVLQEQAMRISARTEAGRDALVDLITQMSPDERSAFAERLEHTLARRSKDGGRSSGGEGDDN